jgi:hypothetical protein
MKYRLCFALTNTITYHHTDLYNSFLPDNPRRVLNLTDVYPVHKCRCKKGIFVLYYDHLALCGGF